MIRLHVVDRRGKRSCALVQWIACIAMVLCCGCSTSELDTAPVRGTVTLDGKAIDSGMVFFRPERGRMAIGKIQPDGTYVLFTYVKDGSDGAIVGRHHVTVVPPMANGPHAEAEAPTMAHPIPEKYHSEATSNLQFDVQPGRTNVIDIVLESKNT